MDSFSFKKGFMQVKHKDIPAVRAEIMSALNINNRASWSSRLNGEVEPKVSEAAAIEAVLKKYGVTKEIWGK